MLEEKKELANRLSKEIKELEFFIYTLDTNLIERGSGHKDVSALLSVKISREFSIKGKRVFGLGSHVSTYNCPEKVIKQIVVNSKIELEKLKREYSALWAD